MKNNEKKQLIKKTKSYLLTFFNEKKEKNNVKEKLNNICNKTGRYSVPANLWQCRTSRSNRVLISFKDVLDNKLDLKELESFEGGVVVEFVNDDIFNEKYFKKPIFKDLILKLGSNEQVSSIITFRNIDGTSSSGKERECFEKFKDTWLKKVVDAFGYDCRSLVDINNSLHKGNMEKYYLKQNKINNKRCCGKGNDSWDGFLYVFLKGGQQETISSISGEKNKLTLFNPACEYASSHVINDINLVMLYFALHSVPLNSLESRDAKKHISLLKEFKKLMASCKYECDDRNLLEYCEGHICLGIEKGVLYDPIQLKKISILDFAEKSNCHNRLDVSHNKPVSNGGYYFDNNMNTIVSSARPHNLFWSYHESNMLQQDSELYEYFITEQQRVVKRIQNGLYNPEDLNLEIVNL